MPLDLKMRLILLGSRFVSAKDPETLPLDQARKISAKWATHKGRKTRVAQVENHTIQTNHSSIPVRIYTPQGNGPFPILVYFHGGGFVMMNLDTHDETCRKLCKDSNYVVISVDYRLAPEHKFPTGLIDCLEATKWAFKHSLTFNGNANCLVVGGDSAGGNLAALVCLKLKEQTEYSIKGQLLIYPATDYHTPGTKSYFENAEGYMLSRKSLIWFWDQYLNGEQDIPHAVPLRAINHQGLPPALIITAEYDPLRDEGEAYGHKLKEAKVNTTVTRYKGMVHGFFGFPDFFKEKKLAHQEAAQWLKTINKSVY